MPFPIHQLKPFQLFRTRFSTTGSRPARGFGTSTAREQRYPPLPLVSLPKTKADLFQRSKPITAYLGDNPFRATFQQGKIENCYLHATVDAMQHHRLGKTLLKRIRVQELPAKVPASMPDYRIHFPSGRHVKIRGEELGQPQDGHTPIQGATGFQMLELAYAKLVSRERNRNPVFAPKPFPNGGRDHALALVGCGLPSEAMGKMLVGHRFARFTRGTEDPKKLARIVQRLGRDRTGKYLLCAITQEEGMGGRAFKLPPRPDGTTRNIKQFTPFHSYSIRDIQPDGTVTIANPHDTGKELERLTLSEFGSIFTCIDGIRFKPPVGKRAASVRKRGDSAGRVPQRKS